MEIKHFAEFKYKDVIYLVDKSVEVNSSDIYEIAIPDKNVDAIELFDRAFDEVEINGEKQILKSNKFNIQRFVIQKEGIRYGDRLKFFPIKSVKDQIMFLPQEELKYLSSKDFAK